MRRVAESALDALRIPGALRRSYAAMEYFAGSPDFREGVASFTEKRAPTFDPLPADFDPEEATRDGFLPY